MYSKIIENQMLIEEIVKYGHFNLSSGKHSDTYVQKDRINLKPTLRHLILSLMVDTLLPHTENIDIITGPAVAGAIWAASVADRLHLPFVYPEKQPDGSMKFGREYPEAIKGKVLIQIEDIITTSKSVMKTTDAIEECGGICGGVVCIWNRGNWRPPDHWFYKAIVSRNIDSYIKEDCPDCQNPEKPLTDPKTDEILSE